MRTVRDVMTAHTVSVTQTTPVHSAILLMRTHGLLTIPVLDDGVILGVLDAAAIFMYQPDVAVGQIMGPPVSVDAGADLSSAAILMQRHGLAELPVTEENLAGSLKALDLLSAWAMPVDSLTGLPWQDAFRLRSSTELAAGKELTLLFFDLDDFGALNKDFGHVVGDRALKAVSAAIRSALDPRVDQACRFGGDEFVVSTTRPRSQAIEWAADVQSAVSNLEVEGLSGRVGISVGVSGGLRQGERPGTHGPSTLDDLINRASQASTLAKKSSCHLMSLDQDTSPAPTPPRKLEWPQRTNRIRIRSVRTEITGGSCRAEVRLEHAGIISIGTHTGIATDRPGVVAEAAARAIAQFIPPAYAVIPISITEQHPASQNDVMMAVVSLDGPHGRMNLMGVSESASDKDRASVKAVLDAVNRPLEAIAISAGAVARMVEVNGGSRE